MGDFSKYLGINWTFSLICCMFWIFSPAEGYTTISQVVGSKVSLHCNRSLSSFVQLTWKMNGVNLYSFKPPEPLYIYNKAVNLNINMSLSESEQYALVMDQAQNSHAGNYTCEVATPRGPWEHTWELIVTDGAENRNKLVIVVAAVVPCVCCLVIIFSLTFLKIVHKQCAKKSIQSPTTEMQEQTEDIIYENCLEIDVSQRHNNNQLFRYKTRTQYEAATNRK